MLNEKGTHKVEKDNGINHKVPGTISGGKGMECWSNCYLSQPQRMATTASIASSAGPGSMPSIAPMFSYIES